MTPIERETFQEAIRKWGDQAQVNMLHEEMGELMVALNKLNRSHVNHEREVMAERVIEEIEDVRIMLDQVALIVGASSHDLNRQRETKIARLRFRLGMEQDTARRTKESP